MKRDYRNFNIIAACLGFCLALLLTLLVQPQLSPAFAQGSPGVGGFLDEDGDGFNDLMPDSDGDGVPDAIDPDFHGHQADSSFMRQHMYGDSTGMMHRMMNGDFMNMDMHGEPGMYGPGDSTMHGMHGDDGGHHDGGHMGGGGGMNPDSGMGGGGMMGPGPGKIGDGAAPQPIEIIHEKSPNLQQAPAESRN
jgi:hypothetical protein